MAFVLAKLQSDIYSVFTNMGDSATNKDFADGISNAVVSFVSTGQVSTSDTGKVTGGTFVDGEGNGTLSVTASGCSTIILNACNYMLDNADKEGFNGNNYLAEKIGEGLMKMANDGTVTTTVLGKLITDSTPPTTIEPYGGGATGTISCSSSSLVDALKSLFTQMYDRRSTEGYNGNLEFAKELAKEIKSFWENGSISTKGEGNIEGSSGSGSIS